MSVIVSSTVAPQPKTVSTKIAALFLAGVIVLFAVAQLFSFERFPELLVTFGLTGVGQAEAVVVAALLVVAEVLAVPFLLRMRLSYAMRALSMAAGWLVGLWWLFIAIGQSTGLVSGNSTGFLGATVGVPTGVWAVFFMVGICILIGWVAWGMGSFGRKAK